MIRESLYLWHLQLLCRLPNLALVKNPFLPSKTLVLPYQPIARKGIWRRPKLLGRSCAIYCSWLPLKGYFYDTNATAPFESPSRKQKLPYYIAVFKAQSFQESLCTLKEVLFITLPREPLLFRYLHGSLTCPWEVSALTFNVILRFFSNLSFLIDSTQTNHLFIQCIGDRTRNQHDLTFLHRGRGDRVLYTQ